PSRQRLARHDRTRTGADRHRPHPLRRLRRAARRFRLGIRLDHRGLGRPDLQPPPAPQPLAGAARGRYSPDRRTAAVLGCGTPSDRDQVRAMSAAYCGLDFGTSNTTLALHLDGRAMLCPLEGDAVTLPSAVFFDFEEHVVRYGRDAVRSYIDGAEGRLLRALKSVLGSQLIN